MLRELAKLSGGMLVLHGHVTDAETLRRMTRDASAVDLDTPSRGSRGRVFGNANRDWRSTLELVVAGAIGGGSFLFLRIAAPAFGPAPVIDLRLAIGALILTPFLWRARAQLAAAGWWKIVLIGACNNIVPFLLFAWSSERAPAGVNAIVFSMSVPFTALVAFAFFGEHMGGRRVMGMLAGLVGVVVLAGGELAGAGLGAAVAAGTVASLLYGGAANLVRRQFAGVPATALVAAMLASSALLLAPFAIWLWPSTPISLHAWASAVALGAFGTAVLYVLYFRLIQRIGATRAMTIAYLAPAFGVLWAWLALGEPLTLGMFAGGLLILGGMLYGRTQGGAGRAPHAVVVHAAAARPCVGCGN